MAEPLKNMLDEAAIRGIAAHLCRVDPRFDGDRFIAFATWGLDGLELKQRSTRITEGLERFLPDDFAKAMSVLVGSLDPTTDHSIAKMDDRSPKRGIAGWPVMPLADFVARNGQDQVELSLQALREMTMRSSSEFAIRDFLELHPASTLAIMAHWAKDDNEHVRRLVSEGSRPRLPWGKQLRDFVADPTPVVALLELLKDDPSEYVRRSVANNLNDIAKDHPDLVCEIAKRWMVDASSDRVRLVKHALRSLVKAGNPSALQILGFSAPELELIRLHVQTPTVLLGEALEFDLEIRSTASVDQDLMIDYVVHHMKADGATTPKVFKWKTVVLSAENSFRGRRRHPMRPITTRRYYPGDHRVEIQINGEMIGIGDFVLRTE